MSPDGELSEGIAMVLVMDELSCEMAAEQSVQSMAINRLRSFPSMRMLCE